MLVGSSNSEKIWNWLKSKGLNDFACAGIIGNLDAESGLNPKNLQDSCHVRLGFSDDEYTALVDSGVYTRTQFVYDRSGFGTAQWTWHTRKAALYDYAKSKAVSIGDLEMQLNFFYKELSESFPGVLNGLKTANSVREASDLILLKYECPADTSESVRTKRASFGQKYYTRFAMNQNKEVVMGYITFAKGASKQLSEHFNSTEFDCHGSGCCTQTVVNEKLVEYLQKIRNHFKSPITITSGYRCTTHNVRVGGATGSRHTKGDAADIVVKNTAPSEVAKYAESIGIKGIGLYSDFVHIDTRTTKSFWYGHEEAYRSTFGGANISPDTDVSIDVNGNENVNTNSTTDNISSAKYVIGKTYHTQVVLNVRFGAGTNYTKKTYAQLTVNARKNATGDGCLKKGTAVTCLETKHVGDDIWIRIPSGWCAAYCKGEYYIK